jgi:hypothetical protein
MQALMGWQLIADKYAKLPMTPLSAAFAIEDGAMHTHKVATRENAALWLQDPGEDSDDTEQAVGALCSGRLDSVAAKVQELHPALFECAAVGIYLRCQRQAARVSSLVLTVAGCTLTICR